MSIPAKGSISSKVTFRLENLPAVSRPQPDAAVDRVRLDLTKSLLFACSLLKEAEPLSMDSNRDISEISTNKGSAGFPGSGGGSSGAGSGSGSGGQFDSATLEERQLLGRYGVWLLVGLCTPNQDTSIEILGRLLSMLFHWFHVTAYSFDGTKKSLMHLIFSVGNLTLRIFIHLMNVERRWAADGRRRVFGRRRDVASKFSKWRSLWNFLTDIHIYFSFNIIMRLQWMRVLRQVQVCSKVVRRVLQRWNWKNFTNWFY